MFRNHRLYEHGRRRWVETRGQERHDHLVSARAQVGRLVRDRDGVIVDHAEERFVAPLELDPVLHRSEIVTDVQLARRLDAAEDS